jgi:hypothetical protein
VATEIVELTPELLPALRRFAERVWTRPRSEAYYRWRYETLPMHRVWLAVRDGEVLAMEAALARPYRLGDDVVEILEVFDWYCLPELRRVGLGVRVQQRLMKESPCLLVGGSEDTRGLLPRLGFAVIAQAGRYVAPLGVARLADAIRRRLPVPEPLARAAARGALALPGRKPRPRRVPRGGRVFAVAAVGDEVAALYRQPTTYAALPLWPPDLLRWLQGGFPAVGHFVPLLFAVDGALRGFALVRIHPTPHGADAELIECFAPTPDAALYTWMVSEAATRAAAFGVGLLGACTPCPLLAQALRANGFVHAGDNPVQLWLPDRPPPAGPLLVGSNSGDAPLVPFAESWWDGDLQQRPTDS